jgi:hypothetical protein
VEEEVLVLIERVEARLLKGLMLLLLGKRTVEGETARRLDMPSKRSSALRLLEEALPLPSRHIEGRGLAMTGLLRGIIEASSPPPLPGRWVACGG